MRENMGLFRGKRIDTGEWVEGFLLGVEDQMFILNPDGTSGKIDPNAVEVDPATVGQWTGLLDKSGVKIFEGDVLSVKTEVNIADILEEEELIPQEITVKVAWVDEVALFDLQCSEPDTHLNGWGFYPDGMDAIEIIGNIHDNPVEDA